MSSPVVYALRKACPPDAAAIAAVLAECWPDDTPNASRIASLIGVHGRGTVVAVQESAVVGVVDAFVTVATDGLPRWEIDLLAVEASARGESVGRRLIAEAVRAAPSEAQLARALVRLGNRPAERAFAGAGFVAGEPHGLFTAAPQSGPVPAADTGLTRVETLTYSGVWIERRISEMVLREARALAFAHAIDQVGVVVKLGSGDTLQCERAGFRGQGVFRWWSLVLGEGLSKRSRDIVANADYQ